MTVVTNTSPLNYLLLIGEARLLPQLFERLHLPAAVREELRDPAAANLVRAWAETPPVWAELHVVPPAAVPTSVELHRGETEAILLAQKLRADLLLMDELDGRAAARAAGPGGDPQTSRFSRRLEAVAGDQLPRHTPAAGGTAPR